MTVQRVAGSFRDPAGFVFSRDGTLFRQVNRRGAEAFELLVSSGLYTALTDAGLLVRHTEVDLPPADPAADPYRILQPEPVPFVSFPYEWCPGQLRDAALATLEIQRTAMDHGMSLRDASAYNIQLVRGRPVLIDTLSFEPLVEGRPWVAYRQFCQHFLAPLALMAKVDVRLGALLRSHIDGVPLDLAAQLLPARSKLTPGLGLHIAAHARRQARHAADSGGSAESRGFGIQAFRGLVDSLAGAVTKLEWEPAESAWRDYYAAGESYSGEAMSSKEELVAKIVADLSPATVWDLGANTGRFSGLAATAGAEVVALEGDPSAVEIAWRDVRKSHDAVLPLVCDLTNPSPSLGWASAERPSLAARGPVDLAMALALVHHLAIGGNVPLDAVASWFGQVCHHLLLEWVPKHDPMVQRLLSSREDVFDSYTEDGLRSAFEPAFTVERRESVEGSDRVLYLFSTRR